jgi:hypothetical protein
LREEARSVRALLTDVAALRVLDRVVELALYRRVAVNTVEVRSALLLERLVELRVLERRLERLGRRRHVLL